MRSVIAEVSLNHELRYGVKWYAKNKNSKLTFSDAASGAIALAFPGFATFFQTSNIAAASS